MISIDLKINNKDLQKLYKMSKRFHKGRKKAMQNTMYMIERTAKRRMGRPGELKVRSGHLRRSIKSSIKEYQNKVIGSIGSDVVYARIHELGGVIRPIRGEFLRFQVEGQWKSVKQVRIPKRPYLRPSIEENIPNIRKAFIESIVEEVER